MEEKRKKMDKSTIGQPRLVPVTNEISCTHSDSNRAKPTHVFGEGRVDTSITAECRGEVFVKSGAEGVMAASIPALGYGLAVKIDDGAHRAAQQSWQNFFCRCSRSPVSLQLL